jgi:O-antigen/teichoic acid export membrane protein
VRTGSLHAHALRYASSSLLVSLAGFVSFPILTRILSVAEYGAMSWISSALTLLVVLGKLGLQHALLRFHAEVEAGRHGVTQGQYLSTVLFGQLWGSVGALLIGAACIAALPAGGLSSPLSSGLLLLALLLLPIRVLDSAIANLLRAQQRSSLLGSYNALRRWAVLALVLGVLLAVQTDLTAFYLATLAAEFTLTGGMAWYALRGMGLSWAAIDRPLLRAMLWYATPMVGYDLSGVLLNLGDRFFIEALLGPEALGQYSAAYNLCDYASILLLTSLNQALTPICLKMWETDGPSAVRDFIDRSLHTYLLASAAMLAAGSAMGGDALALLASERYRDAAVVIPTVLGALLLCGCVPLMGMGLTLAKQSGRLTGMILFSAAVNMALNAVLIAPLGLQGAALATLAGYALQLAGATLLGWKVLPVRIPLTDVLRLGLCAGLAYLAMQWVNEAGARQLLMLEAATGLLVFTAAASLVDPRSRATFLRLKHHLLSRSGRAASS